MLPKKGIPFGKSPPGGGWGWESPAKAPLALGMGCPRRGGTVWMALAAPPRHLQHQCHVLGSSLVLPSRKAGFRALGLPPWPPGHYPGSLSTKPSRGQPFRGSVTDGSRSSGGISALVTSLAGIPLTLSTINCKFLAHKAQRERQDLGSGESPRDTARAAAR